MSAEDNTRRTFVTIEVEMGCDDEWFQVGLDERPEDAETLLTEIRSENSSIREFIRNWALDDYVTVNVVVRHSDDAGKVVNTVASWTQP